MHFRGLNCNHIVVLNNKFVNYLFKIIKLRRIIKMAVLSNMKNRVFTFFFEACNFFGSFFFVFSFSFMFKRKFIYAL